MSKKKKLEEDSEEKNFLSNPSIFLLFVVGTFLLIYGLNKNKDWMWLLGIGLIIFLNMYLIFNTNGIFVTD